ncbi:MAG: DUF5329 family protein [Luteimonas sp.]|nr:DUF5329 family protein [Luteimonas sp.]
MRGARHPARGALLLALALAAPLAAAAEPEAEIAALIEALGSSGCEFQRNGAWHGAARARAHLQRKYDWLRARGLAETPELFIERAASRSSASGQAYRVRCPGQPETSSAEWFDARLRRLREAES